MQDELRRGRHVVYRIHAHLVFVPRYRRKIFDADALDRLRTVFSRICSDFEATLDEFNGESDHVHLLVHYPPKVAVSALVNSLKGVSARRLRQERPDIARHYWRGGCGQRVTLRLRAAVRRLKYCVSILSNNAPRSDRALRGALCIPALKDGVLRATS